ncbi:hypothetical protein QUF88_19040 [Bacillus sp. DX1.1]|uniref:hypothetical protein n=1 Tax=unclassified Bacillus (in: firmicutes) TaxID=185979 RepID=UPI002570D2BB|nr:MULTISPECIES: hypothetical protein [unclassified Bacillus (in: firmicutes)]MDM5155809.1 hypothetical protein [Bacillus sp. DX1.1]MDM5189331.1 hypothetical protein [Bacillus sp. DX4.1]WJE80107.1 hypothetical protein QRE67_16570 [Bacillus sp. DX3.1]
MFHFCKSLFLFGAISTWHLANVPQIQEQAPEIIKTYTNIPEIDNWVTVPKDTKEIIIYVKAKHTETMLFWLIPTGTATWKERKLLGYDTDGTDGWSLKWHVSGRILHDHIHVQALGSTSISNDSINVHSQFK